MTCCSICGEVRPTYHAIRACRLCLAKRFRDTRKRMPEAIAEAERELAALDYCGWVPSGTHEAWKRYLKLLRRSAEITLETDERLALAAGCTYEEMYK